MRRATIIAWAIVIASSVVTSADADPSRRVALVIANADYINGGSLKNPVSDGLLIKGALKRAGFEIVDAPANLGAQAFRNALRTFQGEADGAQVALVYYAGHGIEARGRNWLIPTDAVLEQDRDLDYEAINLDLVLNAIEGARMRVVVLDACRNNPFGKSWKSSARSTQQGLAPVDFDDVLVIYSAAPGQTASDGTGVNSPFAEALARRLPQAGVPIQMLGGLVRDDVLEATGGHQRPFINASITGVPFLLVPIPAGKAGPQVSYTPPPVTQYDPRATELAFWQSVAQSSDAAELSAYLDRYPTGDFAALARAKIHALNSRKDAQPSPSIRLPENQTSGPAAAGPSQAAPLPQLVARAAVAALPSRFNKPDGYFAKRDDTWVEYPPYSPNKYFTFNNFGSDADYIYLIDRSRSKDGDTNNSMLIRLPIHGGAAQWSYQNPMRWIDFTIVTPASGP